MYRRNATFRIAAGHRRIIALGIVFITLCCTLLTPVDALAPGTPSEIPVAQVQEAAALACTCIEKCTDEHTNSDCPVCSANHAACEGIEQAEETVPLCICTEKCTDEHTNSDCLVCAANHAACEGIEQAEETVPLCICTEKCTDEHINAECPVCAANHAACEGIEQIAATLPVYELVDRVLDKTAADGALISVSGLLPAVAELEVTVVPIEDVTAFVDEGDSVLFAYDIKIMVPATHTDATPTDTTPEMTEYQPTVPVSVSITPPEDKPIDAPVEVTHIDADNNAAPVEAETVDGTVEFEAEGFSIYIGTVGSGTTITLTHGSGYTFYSDAAYTNSISGQRYVAPPTTIYLKANANYRINAVTVKNEDGTASTATVTNVGDSGFEISFPSGLDKNQLITVATYVTAGGGTISASSTAASVAAMFDATARTALTDNVFVSGSSGVFTVEVKNNILLQNTIIVASDASVTLTTSGEYTIKRDLAIFTQRMFEVSGTLSLGTGTEGKSTVTFHFNNGTSTTVSPDVSTLPSVPEATILGVTVNRGYRSTMTGALTIDGGAVFTAPLNLETRTPPTASTPNTASIIHTTGTLRLWDGVTLQNQYNIITDDQSTAAGMQITGGSFYMYGGVIKQCSTYRGASYSDGGGICFHNGKAFFYGGEITQCCADNGSAVAMFGAGTTPEVYYLGTSFHHNLAGPAQDFPGQACSAYNGAAVRMYDGSMINNRNTAETHADADYDLKPSGSKSTVYLFGGTIGKLGVIEGANVEVYNCAISEIEGNGKVTYPNGEQRYAVTVPDCVAPDSSITVNVTIKKQNGTDYNDYYSLSGTGNGDSADSILNLPTGTYKIIVESPSMQKEYAVTVQGTATTATPNNRSMATPTVVSQTNNSITLNRAGTGNTIADGEIYYGYSNSADSTTVPENGAGAWQSDPTFTNVTGDVYFFIKASATSLGTNNFPQSISPALHVNFNSAASVVINGDETVAMKNGDVKTFTIIATPTNYPIDRIRWSISGQTNPDTTVVANSDGSGSVKVALREEAASFTLKVELLGENFQPILNANDTVTIMLDAYAYIDYDYSILLPELTAHLLRGSSDGSYTYKWQRSDAGSSYTDISGATSEKYTVTNDDLQKDIRVIITDSVGYHTSEPITARPPTISATVPLNVTVVVDANGDFTTPSSDAYMIKNYSTIDIYLTNVSLAWDEVNAPTVFSDYAKLGAALTLDSTQYSFGGNTMSCSIQPSRLISKTNGMLPLKWSFELNRAELSGNYIKAVQSVNFATVTYTVSYIAPTS